MPVSIERQTILTAYFRGLIVKKHRKLLIVLGIILAVVLIGAGGGWAYIAHRISQQDAGTGAVPDPGIPQDIEGSVDADGRIDVHAEYTSVAAGSNTVTTDFVWDDNWFFEDSTTYNHELAIACSVLSAVANSESEYYQEGSGAKPYMEDVLAQMGFEKADTSSYQYRSEIKDEVANIFNNGTNVTAYTVASKHIKSSTTGTEKLLVAVAVRGTYGSEWLGNLDSSYSGGVIEGFGLGEGDYEGFSQAAGQLSNAVFSYLESLDEDIDMNDVALLFTGHSRGAATSNMAAAYIDSLTVELEEINEKNEAEGLGEVDAYPLQKSIYCYTFATPEHTTNPECHSATYANIFNIINPSDIVPRVPLAVWGFDRYGTDYYLPEPGVEGFDEEYEAVKATYKQSMGVDAKYDPDDAAVLDKLIEQLGKENPTVESFETLGGMVDAIKDIVTESDIVRVIQSHVPNVYIAWMQNLSGLDGMRTSR